MWVTLRLRASGSSLSVDVNGVTQISASDATFSSGQAGVWSYQPSSARAHSVDDFTITQLVASLGGAKALARPIAAPRAQTAPQPPPVVTKYYTFNGQRVAIRKNNVVTWLHSDMLGSASLATDVNGNLVPGSETRYTPYGEVRPGGGGLPTDRLFTGYAREQASYVGALDFAQARYYSPYLGRFISADTLVQAPGDPQTLNRYGYTRNNPLKYVDPSGHCIEPISMTMCAVVIGGGLLVGGAAMSYAAMPPSIRSSIERDINSLATDIGTALTTPLGDGPSTPSNTAHTSSPAIDASPSLGFPLGPVQGAGVGEAYPLAEESGTLQLSTPLGGSPTLQFGGPMLAKVRNSSGDAYPSIKDPRTGRSIEFPTGQLTRVSPNERVNWGPEERGAYIKEWYDRGFKTPKGGWERYDIHHVKPREFGGTNDFQNLVPVERSKHKQFNKFWERYP